MLIGVDLVKTARIVRFIERFGNKGLQRFLSDDEMALIKQPHTAAGFWAAKEACAKALGCGIGNECGFHDILLTKSPKGAPLIDLTNSVKVRFDIASASLSISHDGDYAIAIVVLLPTS